LKNQHRNRDQLGGGLVGAAAKFAATRLTRRSLVCRLGYAVAALAGAEFLVADGPRALAKVAANPPCAFSTALYSAPGGGKCGKNGMLCGISKTAALCSDFAACPGCLQASGCPQGRKAENSWTGCCSCLNLQASYLVQYTDCCSGTIANQNGLPAVCSKNCIAGNAGCPNNAIIQSWCSGLIFQDNYICTAVSVTSTKC
jgi:hypothetical protein